MARLSLQPSGPGDLRSGFGRFALPRLHPSALPVEVEVALIRDWRRLLPAAPIDDAADNDWKTDLAAQQVQFWMDKCEQYCRELRQVLRHQEDLQAQARDMYE